MQIYQRKYFFKYNLCNFKNRSIGLSNLSSAMWDFSDGSVMKLGMSTLSISFPISFLDSGRGTFPMKVGNIHSSCDAIPWKNEHLVVINGLLHQKYSLTNKTVVKRLLVELSGLVRPARYLSKSGSVRNVVSFESPRTYKIRIWSPWLIIIRKILIS